MHFVASLHFMLPVCQRAGISCKTAGNNKVQYSNILDVALYVVNVYIFKWPVHYRGQGRHSPEVCYNNVSKLSWLDAALYYVYIWYGFNVIKYLFDTAHYSTTSPIIDRGQVGQLSAISLIHFLIYI